MRAWRWPALVLLPGLVAAALVVSHRTPAEQYALSEVPAVMPIAGGPGAASSTWYCAGGTATGTDDGVAEQTVVVANASGEPAEGSVTAFPSEGEPVTRPISVPARDRIDLRVSDLVVAPYASALVEVEGGEVAVQREVSGPLGRDVAACASAPSATWFLPAGTTRPGTRMVLVVFNPFPGEAVLDIAFETDEGTTRRPQQYQSLVVDGGSVVALDVTEVVTLRAELSTTVVARSGRVVVDQIQTGDGTEGTQRGLSVTLGAPAPAVAWMFPDGIGAAGYTELVVVANPSTAPAEVDVQVVLDEPEVHGVAEPFEMTIPPGGYEVVDVFADGRVPVGVAHKTVVRSRNDVPVVAQRVVSGGEDAAQPGVSSTMGSPLLATRWLAPVGAVTGSSGSAVVVSNPSTVPARVVVRASGGGRTEVVEGMDGIELAPGARAVLDLGVEGPGPRRASLEVGSDQPVVVETRFGFAEGEDFTYLVAVPVRGSATLPGDMAIDLVDDLFVVGG